MTQENKELLLKDLCSRLPYGVKVQFKINSVIENKYKFIYNVDGEYEYINIGKSNLTLDIIKMLSNNCIDDIKPYLFPLSSMTEEEFAKLKEYSGLKYDQLDLASFQNGAYKCLDFYLSEVPSYVVIKVFDWLNKYHFDYRGLVQMDLANDATGLNIY